MENNEILLKPAISFAVLKILPLIFLTLLFLLLAWYLSPFFVFFSIGTLAAGWYRLLYIRKSIYLVTPEVVRISRGIFFKRTDMLEIYRVKDYVITQSFILQLLGLMNLTLKSTDAENPVIWMVGIPESDVIDTIRDYVQEARKHNRIYEIN
ncbi:PH domain-containing protein [Mucilaginibacter sp. L3T2-6]|uniref:PH domain-containing protein n=1 Tax=Mucilaginibacter sp. L3T2-6 TaxID=3062491 RepID=UPI0026765870|nr:PH domain-containing protein [Mucilaginibacter sp. L3T2-6]MDO3643540.1 PH domain-containing protein [Mucilaginibacter sp. L3T2-6]MDV6215991.1 PH domain-containing protein [Mucilaginibacter sp. L3T2-6]